MDRDMLIHTNHFKAFELLLFALLNPTHVLNEYVAGLNGFIEHPTQTQIYKQTTKRRKKSDMRWYERQPVPAHSWQPSCYVQSRSGIVLWKEAGQFKFIGHDGRKHRIWIEKWKYALIHESWNGEKNQDRIVIDITWKWYLYKLSLRTTVFVISLLVVSMCQENTDRNYKL